MNGNMVIGNGCGKLKYTVSTLLSGKTKDMPDAQIAERNLGYTPRKDEIGVKYL